MRVDEFNETTLMGKEDIRSLFAARYYKECQAGNTIETYLHMIAD
jgi:hypothetical protein